MRTRLALVPALVAVLFAAGPASAAPGQRIELTNPRGMRFAASASDAGFAVRVSVMALVGDVVTSATAGAPEVEPRNLVCLEVALSFSGFNFSFVNCLADVPKLDIVVDETLSSGTMKGKIGGGTFNGERIEPITIDVSMRSSQQQQYEPLDDPGVWYDDPDVSGRLNPKGQSLRASGPLYTRRGLPSGEFSHPATGNLDLSSNARFIQWAGVLVCRYERSPSSCYPASTQFRASPR